MIASLTNLPPKDDNGYKGQYVVKNVSEYQFINFLFTFIIHLHTNPCSAEINISQDN